MSPRTIGSALLVAVFASRLAAARNARPVDRDDVTRALRVKNYSEALSLTDRAAAKRPVPAWVYYERGIALRHLGRTDEAVQAFKAAETGWNGYPEGKSIAMYGRARALDSSGRCEEAKVAYLEYAAFVRAHEPKSADLAESYSRACRTRVPADPEMTDIASALMDGNYIRVIDLAAKARVSDEALPWLDYDRGVAYLGLGKEDAALNAFRASVREFAEVSPTDYWGRSLSLWGIARAFSNAGRCGEATRAYQEYAAFVRPFDPDGARTALASIGSCVIPGERAKPGRPGSR